jgi:hypothetical protein
MKVSRSGILLSALPGAAMLGLFYSLVIHMRYSLGAWPATIGNVGFPASLITHDEVAFKFIVILFLGTIGIVPVAILVCLSVGPWRRFTIYFGIYVVFYAVCWGLMLLAPAPFLNWWWD